MLLNAIREVAKHAHDPPGEHWNAERQIRLKYLKYLKYT